MKRILKIAAPIVNTWAGDSGMNNIILNYEKGREWFIQNYMRVFSFHDNSFDTVFFDYVNIDTLYVGSTMNFQPDKFVNWPVETYSVCTEEIRSKEILDFVKRKIDNGYYVYLYLNWKYLKEYGYTGEAYHEIFVYGYDDEEQVIHATGYMKGKSYGTVTHSYKDFVEAYCHMQMFRNVPSNNNLNRDLNRISLQKFKKDFLFQFSITKFIADLKQYLNMEKPVISIPVVNRFCEGELVQYGYGNAMYEILSKYLEKKCKNRQPFDILEPYFVYNYTQAFLYKLKVLKENGFIQHDRFADEYKMVVKSAKAFLFTCMNYCGKVNMGRMIKDMPEEKIKKQLRDIKEREEKVIISLIEELESEQVRG